MPDPADPLDDLWPFFDFAEMPLGAFGHICAVTPNAAAYARWPRYPAAARPEAGRVATGRGLDAASSRRSGLGEAVELASAAVWGDEPVLVATMSELGDEATPPSEFTGFSASQRRNREAWNQRLAGFDRIPGEDDPLKPIAWVEASCLATGAMHLVPAHMVYLGCGDPFDNAAADVADTNGCACGATAEAATRAAVLELVERDATARWWYGQRAGPNIAREILAFLPEFFAYLLARRRLLRVFDISTDVPIPVAAAVSFEPDGGKVALGFAAHETLQGAALSATIEMLAMESLFHPFRPVDHDWLTHEWLKYTNAFTLSHLQGAECVMEPSEKTPQSGVGKRGTIIDNIYGVRIFLVDVTRREINVPSVKALSPDLCHYKPRFGKRRLHEGHRVRSSILDDGDYFIDRGGLLLI